MTNTYSSDPSRSGGSGASGTSSGGGSDLREQAKNVASDAGDAGKHVVDVAKDETRGVASETKTQARRLVGQVGDELRGQAAQQQSRVATGIRDVGSQFEQMADSADGSGVAANLVRDAGHRVGQVGEWLDERDPKALLEEVKRFARRRPGIFIAVAVGAGVVAGRLTRALASSSGDSGDSGAAHKADSPTRTSGYVGATGSPGAAVPPVTAPPVTPPRATQPPATTTIGNPAVPGGVVGGTGVNPGTGGF
ncbi:MAG: hypothetical protein K0S37_4606 [Microbacterium sp.]|jgi:hypothetical protein|nr:hypothetical protein [Microbacterium sp.]